MKINKHVIPQETILSIIHVCTKFVLLKLYILVYIIMINLLFNYDLCVKFNKYIK